MVNVKEFLIYVLLGITLAVHLTREGSEGDVPHTVGDRRIVWTEHNLAVSWFEIHRGVDSIGVGKIVFYRLSIGLGEVFAEDIVDRLLVFDDMIVDQLVSCDDEISRRLVDLNALAIVLAFEGYIPPQKNVDSSAGTGLFGVGLTSSHDVDAGVGEEAVIVKAAVYVDTYDPVVVEDEADVVVQASLYRHDCCAEIGPRFRVYGGRALLLGSTHGDL